MCEKDYSLLRPFDKAVVKFKDMLIHLPTNQQLTFVCGPDAEGDIVLSNSEGVSFLTGQHNCKIAPLCWVEGKPVYSDSILYGKHTSQQYLGKDIGDTSVYTWQKPQQKKTGWVNIYPTTKGHCIANTSEVHPTKKQADEYADIHRVACIQIEWEE